MRFTKEEIIILNDIEKDLKFWLEEAQDCLNSATTSISPKFVSLEENATIDLSDRIAEFFTNNNFPLEEGEGCYAELLKLSLSRVSFYRLAHKLMGDL